MDQPVTKSKKQGRISFPTPEDMNEAQRTVYDQIVSGPRGTIVGPLRAALHNPVLADRWQRLGQVLRFETSFPTRLNEVAILVAARHWNSVLEWAIHAGDAERAGLEPHVILAIREAKLPDFGDDETVAEIYEFSRQLVETGDVRDDVYTAIVDRWGEAGAVELGAVVGYYSMVAMTLNIHRIPLPEGVEASLPVSDDALTSLPAYNKD